MAADPRTLTTDPAVLYAHARIDALQREVAYVLAQLAAGVDPNDPMAAARPVANIADRMADLMRTFKEADDYAKPQPPDLTYAEYETEPDVVPGSEEDLIRRERGHSS